MKFRIFLLFFLIFILAGCINEYQVTFNTMGGDSIAAIDVNSGDTVDLPTPIKEGHTFLGWFEDEEYKQEFTNESKVTSDLTLFAKWEVNSYTISFDTNGGNNLDPISFLYQENIEIDVVPEKEGHNFIGWYYNNEPFALDKMPAEDITLVAVWDLNSYYVRFDTDGGTKVNEQIVDHGSKVVKPEDPLRTNYTFGGWFEDEELTIPYDFDKPVNGPLTLYAKWVQYLIKFDTNGAGDLAPLIVQSGDEIDKLPIPTKSGVTFLHWTYEGNIIEPPFTFDFDENILLKAVWLKAYGNNKYRDGSQIYIPANYEEKSVDFRGMWVSHLTGDIASFTGKQQAMNQINDVLNTLESWNMNAIVYHVRIHNDALYDTDLSPKRSSVQGLNFDEWDYLEWFIEEAHRRGIEFHAWLNPYRIKGSKVSAQTIAKEYQNYPLNPASNPENILVGSSGAILNPGEPAVREYLIDVCLELMEKYDIDAIHFDDYFYISMDSSADAVTYNKYKHLSNTTNIHDWRREQVDIFIRDLKLEMDKFNKDNNRNVELGISPSGIWKNGDGKVKYDANGTAITNGSYTAGFSHYGSYLYSDTKKWIDEEWIDYIVPQIYWGFNHSVAPYADILDWWAKVVKYKDVKLYSGLGIYKAADASNTDSWKTNPYEFSDQILYNNKLPEVDGVIIFRYNYMKSLINSKNPGALKVINELWTKKANTPK
ncbi:MAG TPA: family 10 glycosylhydrolase [Acholeplasmataceae bacterium]|nr:family 10 glycosylhydrolase [Acholeplasmataceae bacterium]